MKMNRYVGVGALLVFIAGAAFAIAPFVNQQKDPWRFNKTVTVLGVTYADAGIVIGPLGAAIPNSFTGSRSWDFPALGGGAIHCSDSTAITVTGASFGDTCNVSTTFGADGGAGPDVELQFTCYVSAANAAKVRACALHTDAGVTDIADAGYFLRTFGH